MSQSTMGSALQGHEEHGGGAHPAFRTAALMAFLVALLGTGGWLFGGSTGLFSFAALGLLLNLGAYWFSDRLVLAAHRARPISPNEAPALHRIVRSLADAAEMPCPPVYLIPSDSPNAFATGRGPGHAVVAVTRGLLQLLDDRELEAVISHELSHVLNRDVLIATIAAGLAGVISSVGYALRWGMLLGGTGDRRRQRDSSAAAVAWVVVAPIIALLLQLAISRAREYSADSSGARLCGDPNALADALEKLKAWSARRPYEFAGPATAHLFILNPLSATGPRILNLLSTHPPIEERVARLRAMT